jgi:hypothetical protein
MPGHRNTHTHIYTQTSIFKGIEDYASNKPKSFNITRIYMFAILGKEKPDIENIRGLKLAVVRHMIIYVIKFVMQPEQTFMGKVYYNEPGLKEAQRKYYAYMNYSHIMQ